MLLYCDICKVSRVAGVDIRDTLQRAKDFGWKLRSDNVIICPGCKEERLPRVNLTDLK